MKLIIDIPEYIYNGIKTDYAMSEIVHNDCYPYIANGVPLPKGHGRLIDADALKKDDEVAEWLSLDAVRTGKMLKRFSELFIKKIDVAPTVIEADTKSMYYPQVDGITPTVVAESEE